MGYLFEKDKMLVATNGRSSVDIDVPGVSSGFENEVVEEQKNCVKNHELVVRTDQTHEEEYLHRTLTAAVCKTAVVQVNSGDYTAA